MEDLGMSRIDENYEYEEASNSSPLPNQYASMKRESGSSVATDYENSTQDF